MIYIINPDRCLTVLVKHVSCVLWVTRPTFLVVWMKQISMAQINNFNLKQRCLLSSYGRSKIWCWEYIRGHWRWGSFKQKCEHWQSCESDWHSGDYLHHLHQMSMTDTVYRPYAARFLRLSTEDAVTGTSSRRRERRPSGRRSSERAVHVHLLWPPGLIISI